MVEHICLPIYDAPYMISHLSKTDHIWLTIYGQTDMINHMGWKQFWDHVFVTTEGPCCTTVNSSGNILYESKSFIFPTLHVHVTTATIMIYLYMHLWTAYLPSLILSYKVRGCVQDVKVLSLYYLYMLWMPLRLMYGKKITYVLSSFDFSSKI